MELGIKLKWFLKNGIEIEMEMILGIEIELKLKWYANNAIEMEIHNDFSNGIITDLMNLIVMI